MLTPLSNYDGSIVVTPQRIARPKTLEELQQILARTDEYPGPVRAVGRFHSLTPCPASPGTMVDMSGWKAIVRIDRDRQTLTAQAGLQMVEAATALRREGLQLPLNIEIGNMTLGSAACCHSKDSLDGTSHGQMSSYVTRIRWVNPSGVLEQASEEDSPELLRLVRASHGLCGIIYEVTIQIRPLELIRFDYHLVPLAELRQELISESLASNDTLMCWTSGRTVIVKTRNRATRLRHAWLAPMRRLAWTQIGAMAGRGVSRWTPRALMPSALAGGEALTRALYEALHAIGGFSLMAPDKMMNYDATAPWARYAFSFWAFPKDRWVSFLNDYVEFRDAHFRQHQFVCNMPLGSYFIRQDTSSVLSYSYDSDVISIDPIHAPCSRDRKSWAFFLQEFNDWSHEHGGKPLLNQSPYITKQHVLEAYRERWAAFSDWVRSVDPEGRMRNTFFNDLLVEQADLVAP